MPLCLDFATTVHAVNHAKPSNANGSHVFTFYPEGNQWQNDAARRYASCALYRAWIVNSTDIILRNVA